MPHIHTGDIQLIESALSRQMYTDDVGDVRKFEIVTVAGSIEVGRFWRAVGRLWRRLST